MSDRTPAARRRRQRRKVRYAVVGLGHIAQVAVLPAFAHARKNSRLTAIVSGDAEKRRALGEKYEVAHALDYGEYAGLLERGVVDAVYLALPNHLHREYAIAAAERGIHVLCEKPMAPTAEDCRAMIEACELHDVRLMVAYRLHFEKGNLSAVDLIERRTLGTPRYFNSSFSLRVKPGDIRLNPTAQGGGPVYDIGVYCINAARYLFQDEPTEVTAMMATGPEPRFRETHEALSAVMRFPDERIAAFTCSFGAADVSTYRVVGTSGDLVMEPAYEYAEPLKRWLTVDGEVRKKTFRKRDQFAPELIRFSEAVLSGTEPEPSGYEGLADVRIVEALLQSAREGRTIRLSPTENVRPYPDVSQELHRPAIAKPEEIHASGAGER